MSAGFGTENVVFVPAGEKLRVFDLYHWRVLTLPVTQSSVRLRPLWLGQLEQDVESIDKHLMKEAEDRTGQIKHRGDLRAFHELVRDRSHESDALSPDIPFLFGTNNRIWVRLSNVPCESFFTEDYQESAQEPSDKFFPIQVYGSCSLELDDQHEIPFPAEGENAAFELQLASDGLTLEYIPEDKPLPIIDEFCGSTGASSLGMSVNLNPLAEISQTHMISVPLRETDEGLYETLYFQFETAVTSKVIQTLTPKSLKVWENALRRLDFMEISHGPCCRIWHRDGDVIHIYTDCEGKESASVQVLPAFLVCASAGGSKEPEEREHLLSVLVSSIKDKA